MVSIILGGSVPWDSCREAEMKTLEFCPYLRLAGWPRTSPSDSTCLSFSNCKIEIIILSFSCKVLWDKSSDEKCDCLPWGLWYQDIYIKCGSEGHSVLYPAPHSSSHRIASTPSALPFFCKYPLHQKPGWGKGLNTELLPHRDSLYYLRIYIALITISSWAPYNH